MLRGYSLYKSTDNFDIYIENDDSSDKTVIKLSNRNNTQLSNEVLRKEYMIYKLVTESSYFPCCYGLEECSDTQLGLVLEYGGHNLNEILKNNLFTNDQSIQWIQDIIQCIYILHSHGIIHRDIKPENFLVSRDHVKLCDFSISYIEDMKQTEVVPPLSVGSARWYRSPEMFGLVPIYTKSCDIWSLGCIFYEIICKQVAFPSHSDSEHLNLIYQRIKIIQQEIQQSPYPKWLQQLTISFLTINPKNRPSIESCTNYINMN
ncbi:hypothetical protein WA158_006446 [Blastocystis sp. Blastoise]